MFFYRMYDNSIVVQAAEFIRAKSIGDTTGHDWYHNYRVWKTAIYIAKQEGADLFVTELGALAHDIADFKFYGNDLQAGPRATRELLESYGLDEYIIKRVCHIVENVSFKGIAEENKMKSLEGFCVQDADRLDSLGMMAWVRTIEFGASRGRPMYDPNILPVENADFEAYKEAGKTSINHIYEKILHLKSLMNTKTGKILAEKRHKRVERYLEEFFEEWNCEIN